MEFKIKESNNNHIFATYNGIIFIIWRRRTTLASIRQSNDLCRNYAVERQEKILLMSIIEPKVLLPSMAVRNYMVDEFRENSDIISRSSLVIEGNDLRSSSIRTIITGISLFSKPAYPHKVLDSIGAASRYLMNDPSWANKKIPAHILIRTVGKIRLQS